MNKKLTFTFIIVLIVAAIAIYFMTGAKDNTRGKCPDAGTIYDKSTHTCQADLSTVAYKKWDGVVYYGQVNGADTTLEIIESGDKYRMTVDGVVSFGDANTERGWKTADDGTVYILDWKLPESQQTKFYKGNADTMVRIIGDTLDEAATLRALK